MHPQLLAAKTSLTFHSFKRNRTRTKLDIAELKGLLDTDRCVFFGRDGAACRWLIWSDAVSRPAIVVTDARREKIITVITPDERPLIGIVPFVPIARALAGWRGDGDLSSISGASRVQVRAVVESLRSRWVERLDAECPVEAIAEPQPLLAKPLMRALIRQFGANLVVHQAVFVGGDGVTPIASAVSVPGFRAIWK